MTLLNPSSDNPHPVEAGPLEDEEIRTIIETEKFKIEKIISRGHTTPAGSWYDQEKNEWVIVLRGSARLRFADDEAVLEMTPGSHVTIPAHRRHRVEWTDPDQETIWLAVFY